MIFVILGIIVLVVSFVVALISLVREQNSKELEEVVEPKKKNADSNKVAVTQDILKDTSSPKSQSQGLLASEHSERFPWEESSHPNSPTLASSNVHKEARNEKLGGVISLQELAKKKKAGP